MPSGVELDAFDNVYIADSFNNRIRVVSSTSGVIITVAGGGTDSTDPGDGKLATEANLQFPCSIKLDGDGNMYIAGESWSRY